MEDDKSLLQEKIIEENLKDEFNNNDLEAGDLRMGLLSWRPDWLQQFNSIKWFMVALCLASLSQGIIVLGVTLVSLQTIEKEFGFTSKVSGIIVAGNDAAALLLVTVVSFFGTKANKPKWIGIGTLVTGLGVALFASPKLLIGDFKPISYKSIMANTVNYPNVTTGNSTTASFETNTLGAIKLMIDVCDPIKPSLPPMVDCDVSGIKILQIIILFSALFVMGAGTTPIQTLGPAFIDENVTPRASPMYLGIFFATTFLGPGIGFVVGSIFLRTFTDIQLPEGMEDLQPKDPRWIGAWWLGFVSLAGIFFICGFILILFPKKIKRNDIKRETSIKTGQLPPEDITIKYTFKGYLKQLIKICFNKVFMLATMGLTIKTIYVAGLVTFITKLLVLKFGVAPDKAGTYFGLMLIPTMFIGILGGSLIIRKTKVDLAAKTAAKICVIVGVLTAANSCIFLIPGCNNTNMAGIRVPYFNTTSTNALVTQCNTKCNCKEEKYTPVCGSDGVTYHSPCYAGCQVVLIGEDTKPYFGNCSCLSPRSKYNITVSGVVEDYSMKTNQEKSNPMQRMMQKARSLYNKATLGKCDRDCKNFYLFIVLTVISLIVSFLAGTPHKIMVLRCVPDNQRSFALGTQFLIVRSFSFLPAPIILGSVLDSECITWKYNSCGKKESCLDYNIENLSKNLVVLGVITSVLGSICYFFAWLWYPKVADTNDSKLVNVNEEGV